MKNSMIVPLCGLIFSYCATAEAQTSVYVEATPTGIQSSRLAYQLRESLGRSTTLKLVDEEKDSAIQVHLSAMDTDQNSYLTAYSVAWTFTDIAYPAGFKLYNQSFVGICGSAKIAECADSLTAETDQTAVQLRAFIRQALSKKQ